MNEAINYEGKRLRALRKSKGISLAEWAVILNDIEDKPNGKKASVSSLSRIESGKRVRISEIELNWLCKGLGVRLEEVQNATPEQLDAVVLRDFLDYETNCLLFAAPAVAGMELHRSRSVINLYYRFLEQTKNEARKILRIIKRKNEYETISALLAVRLYHQQTMVQKGYDSSMTDHVLGIVYSQSIGRPLTSFKREEFDAAFSWLENLIEITYLNPELDSGKSTALYRVYVLSPASYFCLVPLDGRDAKVYWSYGLSEFGTFQQKDADLLLESFRILYDEADSPNDPMMLKVFFDEKTKDKILGVLESVWRIRIT